jgi:hypothetical protein
MAKKPPAHTGGWGGLGNTKFPGGTTGGGGGPGQQHKRAQHHKHTGGFGGLGNKKFPKGKKKPPVKPGGVVKRAKKHPKRHLAGPALGGWWITGGNDDRDNCAAVAVANSLLLATGYRADDGELLRLHDRAGPLSIPEALAGVRPTRWRVPDAQPSSALLHDGDQPASANLILGRTQLIIGLATPHGPHAALVLGGALVTWGGVTDWPDDWLLEEAWAVTW